MNMVVAVACGMTAATSVRADESRNWDLAIGVAVAVAPFYSGATATGPRLRIWADGAYRTEHLGTFAIDSGSLTIAPEARWDFVDTPEAGIGLLVGYRTGRNDQNPGFASAGDGSTRLRGLPNVNGAVDAGIGGHVTAFGLPLFAQVRTSLQRSQGTLIILGGYLPVQIASNFEITILPTISWANAGQARAFYGVSAAAAVTTGFTSFDPGAGWQNTAVEIGGDWRISGAWHLIASVAYQRLLGNAARSPIVQTANQPSALAGITLHF